MSGRAVRPMFGGFMLLCRPSFLFGQDLPAVGGRRIEAVNKKNRNFVRGSPAEFIGRADAGLDHHLQRFDTCDEAEQAAGGSPVMDLAAEITALYEHRTLY